MLTVPASKAGREKRVLRNGEIWGWGGAERALSSALV